MRFVRGSISFLPNLGSRGVKAPNCHGENNEKKKGDKEDLLITQQKLEDKPQ